MAFFEMQYFLVVLFNGGQKEKSINKRYSYCS